MLKSEFFDRTKVTLTDEEYVRVENVYERIQMNKDDFCKHWKKLHNEPLFEELIGALNAGVEKIWSLEKENQHLKASIKTGGEKFADCMQEFAKRIIRANEDCDLRVYEVVEEQYGTEFIIKTKHEAGISLTSDEIDFLVKKL